MLISHSQFPPFPVDGCWDKGGGWWVQAPVKPLRQLVIVYFLSPLKWKSDPLPWVDQSLCILKLII